MTMMNLKELQEELHSAVEDIDAAIDYAKAKGAPAPLRTRMRAVRHRVQAVAYMMDHLEKRPLVDRAIERVVGGWAKVTGRA